MDTQEEDRKRLMMEIGGVVAAARQNATILSTGRHAALLFAAFPDANFSMDRIINELVVAAAAAGVAVEIARPPRGASK